MKTLQMRPLMMDIKSELSLRAGKERTTESKIRSQEWCLGTDEGTFREPLSTVLFCLLHIIPFRNSNILSLQQLLGTTFLCYHLVHSALCLHGSEFRRISFQKELSASVSYPPPSRSRIQTLFKDHYILSRLLQ